MTLRQPLAGVICELNAEAAAALLACRGYGVYSFAFKQSDEAGERRQYFVEGLCGQYHRARMQLTDTGDLHLWCFTCGARPAALLRALRSA